MMESYLALGYHATAITDHDVYTPDPGVPGILHIPGVEETGTVREGHMTVVGATFHNLTSDPNKVITDAHAVGGLVSLAHPNWEANPWTYAEMDNVHGYDMIEVFNNNRLGDEAYGEDKWDYALTHTLRPVWATAVEDSHNKATGDGYVVVYAQALTLAEIMGSLRDGNFYATQGPSMSVSVTDKTMTVTTDSPSTITFKTAGGVAVKTESGVTTASYTFGGDEQYIRAVVYHSLTYRTYAWSQPIFVRLVA